VEIHLSNGKESGAPSILTCALIARFTDDLTFRSRFGTEFSSALLAYEAFPSSFNRFRVGGRNGTLSDNSNADAEREDVINSICYSVSRTKTGPCG